MQELVVPQSRDVHPHGVRTSLLLRSAFLRNASSCGWAFAVFRCKVMESKVRRISCMEPIAVGLLNHAKKRHSLRMLLMFWQRATLEQRTTRNKHEIMCTLTSYRIGHRLEQTGLHDYANNRDPEYLIERDICNEMAVQLARLSAAELLSFSRGVRTAPTMSENDGWPSGLYTRCLANAVRDAACSMVDEEPLESDFAEEEPP